jgi:signal transduction histidine kinase
MSLRSRLLFLFAALALGPLVLVGVFGYVRSYQAVHNLVVGQTAGIANRVAASFDARFDLVESDLQLLANNAETRRLAAGAVDADRAYLADVWRLNSRWFEWASVRDTAGHELIQLGVAPSTDEPRAGRPATQIEGGRSLPFERVITDDSSGRRLGTLVVSARVDSIAPRGLADMRFGNSGYTMLVQSPGGRVVLDPRSDAADRGRNAIDRLSTGLRTGAISYVERDSDRVASLVRLRARPDLVVISSAALSEFSGPLADWRFANLMLLILVGVAAAIAFALLSKGATRPLAVLTDAADEIGRGNFSPELPPTRGDDVGRLAAAVRMMATHVQEMMTELEANRHMAAVGTFAGQISHEIRNPLTAIKLSLQSLQRDARDGRIPADSRRTVEICLEEIGRLDRVVRGVLRLGRTHTTARQPVVLVKVVDDVLELVRPQLVDHRIVATRTSGGDDIVVLADAEQISGAIMNLLINAVDAMKPVGGSLDIRVDDATVANGRVARITIADSGPGIARELHDRIFDPFFSTKPNGTGLGLALAARSAEEHGGRLALLDDADHVGCTFVLELPIDLRVTDA